MSIIRKRVRTEDQNQECDSNWAGLPQGLVWMITDRLSSMDLLSFARVCKSWQTCVAEDLFCKGIYGIPCLLMTGPHNQKRRRCFGIGEKGLSHELKLPKKTYIWGSFQNWLVVVKLPCKYRCTNKYSLQISLLNPFSGIKFLLPSIQDCYNRVALSAPPTDENCVLMLVGYKEVKELAFWTPKAQSWHIYSLKKKNTAPFETALYCKGCFYILNGDYNMMVIDANTVLSTMRSEKTSYSTRSRIKRMELHHVQMLQLHMPRVGEVKMRYLVESCGEIILAGKFFHCQMVFYGAFRFNVYRLDIGKMAWVELQNLGDRVLLIGRNCSSSISSKEIYPTLANSICFTKGIDCIKNTNAPIFNEWELCSREGSKPDDWGFSQFWKFNYFHTDGKPNYWQPTCTSEPNNWAPTWITAPLWWYLKDLDSSMILNVDCMSLRDLFVRTV